MSMIRRTFLIAAVMMSSHVPASTLVVSCDGGSINGSRTEISSAGSSISDDRVTLSSITYHFDEPKNGAVRIVYEGKEVLGLKLADRSTHKTVAYLLGGVSFLDTIHLKEGVVLSTEHKNLGAPVATTWRLACSKK
jgi:hypothetical protein